jgi:hypothetical protein
MRSSHTEEFHAAPGGSSILSTSEGDGSSGFSPRMT